MADSSLAVDGSRGYSPGKRPLWLSASVELEIVMIYGVFTPYRPLDSLPYRSEADFKQLELLDGGTYASRSERQHLESYFTH
jgi:hypothetical protein